MDMNINILSNSEVQTLNEIIQNAQNIVICCHKSPDGSKPLSTRCPYR